jgi:8-oxo-dGTP pyrophosphatase MutT (NUDIX family)
MDKPPTTTAKPYDELNPLDEPGAHWRRSAVLILIYPKAGEDYIVFMRRTETVAHHKGQISLPGGAYEPTDPDLVYTALREANEELGIDPDRIEVLSIMPDVYARVSFFVITPVIARLKPPAPGHPAALTFRPSPDEVAEVIEVPLSALRDPSSHRTELRTRDNITYNIHLFTYGPYEIWGATGRIIHEFLKQSTEYRVPSTE